MTQYIVTTKRRYQIMKLTNVAFKLEGGLLEMTNYEKPVSADFTLSPMSDDFIEVILGALDKTNTSKVWMETDDVSTVVRGKSPHVFDVTKAICVYGAQTGKHVSFQARYSFGCPGNEETAAYLSMNDKKEHSFTAEDEKLYAAAKFSLYPIGAADFSETILSQIEKMNAYVKVSRVPTATKLEGSLTAMFDGLEEVFYAAVGAGADHVAMVVSISMNSPSHQ